MQTIESFLKEHNQIASRKISENLITMKATSKDVRLSGFCKGNKLEAKVMTTSGNVLFETKDTFKDEAATLSKVKEIVEIYEQTAAVTDDGTDKEKEILLSDAEGELTPTDVVEPETPVVEEPVQNINSIPELTAAILALAEDAQPLINQFPTDDVNNRSVLVGIISGLYGVAEDLQELMEDLEEDKEDDESSKEVTESLSVPSKISYIDIASNGLSQACMALLKTDKYQQMIGTLKDFNSELKTNR